MFHVGQLVICVSDEFPRWRERNVACPRKGTVYTVRELCRSPVTDEWGIYLCEIRNPLMEFTNGLHEPGFYADRFRPIDDSKIEVFRKALKDVPADLETVP